MSTIPKKKLCWNCDGSIPVAVEQCTYCGASQKEGAEQAAQKTQSKQKSAFQPPYSMTKNENQQAPESPFGFLHQREQTVEEDTQEEPVAEEPGTPSSTALRPLLFLIGGSIFFLFGLALFLFSDDGQFTLSWSAQRWYLYLFGGAAALALGWNSLNKVEEA